jgi:multicomponent Na+:H+ antiporter subunit F
MNVQQLAQFVILPLLGLSVILAFLRLVYGPSLPDRVVAFDLLATLGIGITATYAIAADQALYLDVAVVLALLSFLGTVAFAFYLGRSSRPWPK